MGQKHESGVRPQDDASQVSKSRRGSGVQHNHRPRRHRRHAVSVAVRFAPQFHAQFHPQGHQAVAAECLNLSLGGMFVCTPDGMPPESPLRIWLALPDGELMVMGVVRWTSADGMGIQHELLGASDTLRLSDYLISLT